MTNQDNEWKCKACGAIGKNTIETDGETIQDIITCECGHSEVHYD